MLYGQSGIGKTTFAANCHSPGGRTLLLATERGFDYIAGVDVLEIESWDMFKAVVASGPLTEYDTVAVDTAMGLADLCQQGVCKKMGILHPGDMERGRAYDQIGLEFSVTVQALERSVQNLMWITPERILTVKAIGAATVVRTAPEMPVTTMRILNYRTDFIGRAEEKGDKRIVMLTPKEMQEGKNRASHIGVFPEGFCPLDGAVFYRVATGGK